MTYDWTKHTRRSTIESGGRAGASAGGRVYIGVSVSDLRTDYNFWESYIRTIVESYLLPNCDGIQNREYVVDAILDVLDKYEREAEMLVGLRKDLGSVNPDQLMLSPFDEEVQ